MRARFLQAHGRHRPRCHGRCLHADVDSEHNAVVASVLLIFIPTVLFLVLVPARTYWMLIVTTVILLALSLSYLFLAMYTEPGILPTEPLPLRSEDSGRRRQRVTHCIVNGERRELSEFRAKMCRQTENCVEEFDHYCPWVGNAVRYSACDAVTLRQTYMPQVGRRNYRYFIAFVTTVSFLALDVGVSSCIYLSDVHFGNGGGHEEGKSVRNISNALSLFTPSFVQVVDPSWAAIILLVVLVYTVIVLFSVCGLMCFHLRLIALNQTTNENIRGTYFSQKNPHDQGAWKNCLRFATRPIPRSRVISIFGGGGNAVRVPTDEEHADDTNEAALELI